MIYIIRTQPDIPYQKKREILSAYGMIIAHSNLTATFTIDSPIDLNELKLKYEWIITIKAYERIPSQSHTILPNNRNKLESN